MTIIAQKGWGNGAVKDPVFCILLQLIDCQSAVDFDKSECIL